MNDTNKTSTNQGKNTSSDTTSHDAPLTTRKKGRKKEGEKEFQGIAFKGKRAYQQDTIKIHQRIRETATHEIQILDIDLLNPETRQVIFTIKNIEPVDVRDLFFWVAKAIRDNKDFLFASSYTCYRWNGSNFAECELFEQWLFDLAHATGHTTAGTWGGKAIFGSPFAIVMEAVRTGPVQRRFTKVTAEGSCKGIIFNDKQAVFDDYNQVWETLPHDQDNKNFWTLPVSAEKTLVDMETFKPVSGIPYTEMVNEAEIEAYEVDGEEFYDYRQEIGYKAIEDIKWAHFLKRNPYLVKEDNSLSQLGRFLITSLTVDQIEVMQQWFGYHLVSYMLEANLEKFMIMRGQGGDGKSEILKLIDALVGNDKGAVWISADSLDKRTTAMIEGKRAILSSETEKIDLRFVKALISGEPLTAEPKFKDPYFFSPTALMTLAYNPMPNIGEKSEAIARRLIYIEMRGVDQAVKDAVAGGRKVSIAKLIINNEFDLLIQFAMVGATRLLTIGDFDIPHSVAMKTRELAEEGDSVNAFAKQLLIFDAKYCIAKQELYTVYERWIAETGRKAAKDSNLMDSLMTYAKINKIQLEIATRKNGYIKSKWNKPHGLGQDFVYENLSSRPDVIYGVMIAPDNFGAPDGIGMSNLKRDGRGGNHKRADIFQVPDEVRQLHDLKALQQVRDLEKKAMTTPLVDEEDDGMGGSIPGFDD